MLSKLLVPEDSVTPETQTLVVLLYVLEKHYYGINCQTPGMLSIYTSGIRLYILVFMLIDFLLLFTDYLIFSLHNLTSMTTLVCITSLNLRTEVET